LALLAVLERDLDLLVLVGEQRRLDVAVLDVGDDGGGVHLLVPAAAVEELEQHDEQHADEEHPDQRSAEITLDVHPSERRCALPPACWRPAGRDRKSTRLNSSHVKT